MEKSRILVTTRSFGRANREPLRILESHYCEVNQEPGPHNDDELARRIKGYQALIVGLDEVGRNTLKEADDLKIIVKHGVGLDNIDVNEATRRGIIISRTPGANYEAVADLVFALILALARKIIPASISAKKGLWEGNEYMGREVYGKTLGIIGMGHIGQAVARRAQGFEMPVFYYDTIRKPSLERKFPVKAVKLLKLLRESDFITVHLPLSSSTRNFLARGELSQIKKDAYLINTSRGEIVNERDLYEVLKEGCLAGAAADVYSREPPGDDFPLFKLNNFLPTPHIGSYTKEANKKMGVMAAQEVIRVFRGEKARYALKTK